MRRIILPLILFLLPLLLTGCALVEGIFKAGVWVGVVIVVLVIVLVFFIARKTRR